jgi:hypothetical protein
MQQGYFFSSLLELRSEYRRGTLSSRAIISP